MSYTIIIGNKNLSSWSLRPWLVLARCQTPFTEVVLKLDTPSFKSEVGQFSAAGKVPILIHTTGSDSVLADEQSAASDAHPPRLPHSRLTIWDSLAICEYLAEQFPEKNFWPKDSAARALARTVASEMHAGFATLRKNMPMNVTARLPNQGRAPGVQEDIDRICALWHSCVERSGGPFLFGEFSIPDAFFAPVVTRFTTYGVSIDKTCQQYANTIWSMPEMKAWAEAAAKE